MTLATKKALQQSLFNGWILFSVALFTLGLILLNFGIPWGTLFVILCVIAITTGIDEFYWWEEHYFKEWCRYE